MTIPDNMTQHSISLWELKGYHREDIIAAWLERQPPFDNIPRDTPLRKQIMPGPLPPIKEQTEPWGKNDT